MSAGSDLSEFVRKGVAAQNAADRAAGRPTAAELDRDALISQLRDRLGDELHAAIGAARQAARTLSELAGPLYDVEYADNERGSDLAALIETARRELTAAEAQLVR
ncbi:methyltransferase type 11 [Mycolicibacterium grossiae]|uniref:methyltransferase type 11 n=1 Tax=Mycolicibacterium grossiae TaxID=1552759 RepID=UPI0009F19EB6|nr:methyltransferase type 11 [Mycolicibacterium grossiae]